jgi:uncharacterized protein YjbI with pentapeptide repeats
MGLSGAYLREALFEKSSLDCSNLRDANLERAKFAFLPNQEFNFFGRKNSLMFTNLTGANVSGVDFTGADLTGVTWGFKGSKHPTVLRGAVDSGNLPEGLDHTLETYENWYKSRRLQVPQEEIMTLEEWLKANP